MSYTFLERIQTLDPTRTNRVLGSILEAEASLLGLGTGAFSYGQNERARDGGVDGELALPADAETPFPTGETIWQFKSGSSRPSAATEIEAASKEYARERIRSGEDYVLAWTWSPVVETQQAIEAEFRAAVEAVREDAEVHCFFGVHIDSWLQRHPGVALLVDPTPFPAMLRREAWAGIVNQLDIPFLQDRAREALLREVAELTAPDSEGCSLHVFGNPGVGKSRAVFEALAAAGAEERVIYAQTPAQSLKELLAWVVGRPESHLLLVVDDCSWREADQFRALAQATGGRARVITVGQRGAGRSATTGADAVELAPLVSADMAGALERGMGLPRSAARFVAERTEGYPLLAWRVGRAVQRDAGIDITGLTREGFIEDALAEMLPRDEDRELLGVLALFTRVGYELEVAEETSLICEAFEVSESAFREVVDRERDVVRAPGRYRHLTPLLLAVWLGSARLRINATDLPQRLERLSEPLRRSFIAQFQNFGGNPHAQKVIQGLLEGDEPPFVRAEDLANTGGLLSAAAAVDRRTAARVIDALLMPRVDSLGELTDRRELVWSLEYLLWFDDTFDLAAKWVFHLALAENETWANNATGALAGLFRVYLGGTAVPMDRRIALLRELVASRGGDAARVMVIGAAQRGFSGHETRSEPSIGSGFDLPLEWRPATRGEDAETRRAIWDFVIDLVDGLASAEAHEAAGRSIAAMLRSLLGWVPHEPVLEALLEREWPPEIRAKFVAAIRDVLEYDDVPEEVRPGLYAAINALTGDDYLDRIEIALASEPWELAQSRNERITVPLELVQLAEAVAVRPNLAGPTVRIAAAATSGSVPVLFSELGRRVDPDEWYPLLLAAEPLPVAAIRGFFHGVDTAPERRDWVDAHLAGLADDPRLLSIFPQALHAVRASHERIRLASATLEFGQLAGRDFAHLLYGAWLRDAQPDDASALLGLMAEDDDPSAVEATIGMLHQYIDPLEGDPPRELQDLGARMLASTADLGERDMLGYYRQQLLKRLKMDFDARLEMLLAAFAALETFPAEWEGELFDQLVQEDAPRVLSAVLEQLASERAARGWSRAEMYLEDLQLLSRASALGGAETVIEELERRSEAERLPLVAHVAFTTDSPDPVLVWLIENTPGDEILDEARGRFVSKPSSWMGSRIPILQGRRATALAWTEQGPHRFREWAASLIPYYDAVIEHETLREAEDPFFN